MDNNNEFTPDLSRLDEEWVNQSKLYYQYAERLANARRDYDRIKRDEELAVAELEMDIRKNPEKYDLPKVTESCIEKAVVLSKKYQRVHEKVIEAKHDVDVLAAAVSALDHKKKALENLTQLFLANYFSTPRAPKGSDPEQFSKTRKIAKRREEM